MPIFKLSKKAKTDLKSIALYTEREWGRTQRNTYLKQFDECFYKLAENNDIGIACDNIKDNFRQFPIGSHVIFYKKNLKGVIEIIRILHKRMLPNVHVLNT